MKRMLIFVVIVFLCSMSLSCRKKTQRVFIISENALDIFMQPEIQERAKNSNDPVGEVFSQEARPGTIFVYRAKITFGGTRVFDTRLEEIRGGRAYQYNEKGKLEDIGAIDLNKTDAEIARGFGISKGASLHVKKESQHSVENPAGEKPQEDSPKTANQPKNSGISMTQEQELVPIFVAARKEGWALEWKVKQSMTLQDDKKAYKVEQWLGSSFKGSGDAKTMYGNYFGFKGQGSGMDIPGAMVEFPAEPSEIPTCGFHTDGISTLWTWRIGKDGKGALSKEEDVLVSAFYEEVPNSLSSVLGLPHRRGEECKFIHMLRQPPDTGKDVSFILPISLSQAESDAGGRGFFQFQQFVLTTDERFFLKVTLRNVVRGSRQDELWLVGGELAPAKKDSVITLNRMPFEYVKRLGVTGVEGEESGLYSGTLVAFENGALSAATRTPDGEGWMKGSLTFQGYLVDSREKAPEYIGRVLGLDLIDLMNLISKAKETFGNPGAIVQFRDSNSNDIQITMREIQSDK